MRRETRGRSGSRLGPQKSARTPPRGKEGKARGRSESGGGKRTSRNVGQRDGDRPNRFSAERNDRRDRAQRPSARRNEHAEVMEAAVAAPPPPTGVQTLTVKADEDGMRLDRFIDSRFPALPFSVKQRIIRKGEVRIDGGRAKPNARLEEGQSIRIPPLRYDVPAKPRSETADSADAAELRAMILYEDDDVIVLNKPMGLAVQGGSGTWKHVDGMLGALQTPDGQRPRLVHRLDKDTAGCLLIAKTRFAAAALAKTFRSRSARKIYWALVAGMPKVRQGRISTYLAKDEAAEAVGEAKMRIARHGEDGASHAVTYYTVVDNASRICAWVSLKPVTGRTHQLRAHMNHIGNPIVGDPKYFVRENWELPPGIQNRLHLLARRIVVPHPRTGKPIDVTAPLPPHMLQSWNLLTFDAAQYDPIVDAPEE